MLNEYECPILKRIIDEGYCFEITSAAYKLLKMEALDDTIERNTALNYCDKCPRNQFREVKAGAED